MFKAWIRGFCVGVRLRYDFETWLIQNYGLKAGALNKTALTLAKKEYREEYPRPGNGPMRPKTYPFKKYLDKHNGKS